MLALVIACGLWIDGLHPVDANAIGHWGLLVQPVTWYLGLVIGLATATTVCLRGARGPLWLLAPALALLILIIHGTPAIEYALPRYDWTYKHLGVIDALAQGRTSRLLDIYFNWPGFFSAALWLHNASGISLFTLAKWAPPLNEALATAGVWYFATGLFEDRRRAALATLLYLVGNWIAQDYFSPQGLAFGLFLAVVGALIRLTSLPAPDPSDRRGLMAVIVLGWTAILVSHQLTPVILAGDTGVILLVSGRRGRFLRRPWGWGLLLGFGLSEIAWVVLALPYLHKAGYALFTSFDAQGSAPAALIPVAPSLPALARNYSVDALFFGFFAVGGLFGLWRVRRSRSALICLGLLVAPIFSRLVQNYGGEGNLRTYLFAIPFLACLISELLLSASLPRRFRRPAARLRRPPRNRLRTAGVFGTMAVVSAAFLLAYYGQDEADVVGRSDLATITWFYAHARSGTDPVYLAPFVPTKDSARYLDYSGGTDVSLLGEAPAFVSRFVRGFKPSVAAQYLRSLSPPVDFILTDSQKRYFDYFGILTSQRYTAFVRGIGQQPGLRLIYAKHGGYIWSVSAGTATERVLLMQRLSHLLENPSALPRLVHTRSGGRLKR